MAQNPNWIDINSAYYNDFYNSPYDFGKDLYMAPPKIVKEPVALGDLIIFDPDIDAFQVNKSQVVPMSALVDRIGVITPELGLLPPVVRYISPWTDSGFSYVIVESRPAKRSIHYFDEVYEIPFPWMHWGITLKQSNVKDLREAKIYSVRLSFSQTQLKSMDHIFYAPYTPNILLQGWIAPNAKAQDMWEICYGTFNHYEVEKLGLGRDQTSLQDIFDSWTTDYLSTNCNDEASDFLFQFARQFMKKTQPDWSVSYDNDEKDRIELTHEFLKAFSVLTIDEAIELLGHGKSSVKFQDIFDVFEKNTNRFVFNKFLQDVKNLSSVYVAPPPAKIKFVPIPAEYGEDGWSEDDCNEDAGCPDNHFNIHGDHF